MPMDLGCSWLLKVAAPVEKGASASAVSDRSVSLLAGYSTSVETGVRKLPVHFCTVQAGQIARSVAVAFRNPKHHQTRQSPQSKVGAATQCWFRLARQHAMEE